MSTEDKVTGGLLTVVRDIASLPRVALTAVTRICDAIGIAYEPTHQKRLADAEAYKIRTLTQAEVDSQDIRQRAAWRAESEQITHQQNIEAITVLALPHLEETAKPDAVDTDWIRDFFDKCRNVSHDDMRAIWGRILAGEFNHPGMYSRRTLRVLQDFSKHDAELVVKVGGLSVQMSHGTFVPVVDTLPAVYQRFGMKWLDFTHLQDIGVARVESTGVNYNTELPVVALRYFDKTLTLRFAKPGKNTLQVGNVVWSGVGRELLSACDTRQPVPEFLDYLVAKWQGPNVTVEVS